MEIFNYTDYRQYLKDILSAKTQGNPQYSPRAFARDIGVSSSLLSEVLGRKKGLSINKASDISQNLNFETEEKTYFCLMVHMDSVRDAELKENILKQHRKEKASINNLELDTFKLINDWYHFAILELTEVTGFVLSAENAAKSLNISLVCARNAIERLLRLKLLIPDAQKGYRQTKSNLHVGSEAPNKALRNYHRQLLKKAIDSLENQTPQEKFIGSETMSFHSEDLEEASEILEECFSKLTALSEKTKIKNHVYHLSAQFFRLTEIEKHTGELQ